MAKQVVLLRWKDVFKSFKIDVRDFYKARVYLQKHLHIQPSEIDIMYYYEFQWMLDDLKEMLEKENGKENPNNFNPDEKMSEIKNQARSYTKGMGNVGGFKPGNFKMPKL